MFERRWGWADSQTGGCGWVEADMRAKTDERERQGRMKETGWSELEMRSEGEGEGKNIVRKKQRGSRMRAGSDTSGLSPLQLLREEIVKNHPSQPSFSYVWSTVSVSLWLSLTLFPLNSFSFACSPTLTIHSSLSHLTHLHSCSSPTLCCWSIGMKKMVLKLIYTS